MAEQKTEFEIWLEKKNARRSKKAAPKVNRSSIRRAKPETAESIKPKRKKIRSKPKTGFSKETREEAHVRAEHKCENPLCRSNIRELGGEHHCLPRSQYHKADRNNLWNCGVLCEDCHSRVTSPKTPEDKRLRRYFERLAVFRRDCTGDELTFQIGELKKRLIDNTLEQLRSFQMFT